MMDMGSIKGLLADDVAKVKVTMKQGDQSLTVERTPDNKGMTANGLMGGMIGGISPSPVADDKMINVTSGEFVVNQPAAQKHAGLLEDINNEGREVLARGGWTGNSMMSEGYNIGGKVKKIYNEGYKAPGQAYAIAKSMGYNQGGLVGNVEEDKMMIKQHPIFQKLLMQSNEFGYAPEELPSIILEHPQFGQLFDTPEKQEALLLANAEAQSEGVQGYNQGGYVPFNQNPFLDRIVQIDKTLEATGPNPELEKEREFMVKQLKSRGYNQGGEVVNAMPAGGHAKRNWIKKYGATHNPDGTIKQQESIVGNDPVGEVNQAYGITPETTGIDVSVQPGVSSDAPIKPVVQAPVAPQSTPGVIPNKAYDFILEKSRGLAAGKGFGGAKLGAKEYVDELYKPAGGYAKPGTTGSKGSGSKRVFNLEWRDQESGELEVRTGRRNAEGGFELQDENGNWVPAFDITGTNDVRVAPRSADPGVETGAGGIPNAVSYNEATGIPTFEFKRESEGKAYGYVLRAISADKDLTQLEGSIPPEKIASLYGGLAQWAARNANAGITSAVINNYLKEAGLQQYSREMTKFLQAILRNDTGAAYTGTEIADYLAAFGIAPGSVITPQILKTFQDGRREEIGNSIGRTGSAGPYLADLLAGKYPTPGVGNDVGVTSGDGKSGTTSSGVGWKIVK